MAERRELADLGIVSLLIAHQPTLRDALAVVGQYRNRINSTLVLHVEEHDEIAVLREEFALRTPIYSRQANDLALGVLHRLCGSVLASGWQPLNMCFSYPRPDLRELDIYRRMFACPSEFDAEFEGIVLDRAMLDRANPRADPALAMHASSLVGATLETGERSIVQEVEQSIMLTLPEGRASIEAAADALGMNLRTLQRRLKSADTSYSELVERVRTQQVTRHLANRSLRLTDVADLLGYASLGAFTRWFSDRFEESPSAARKRIRARN
jgi:AraC-like DNA-binding protein